ncbi:MAG: hypothetical protein ACRCYO_15195 [Bacteroidia bacterium]
MKTGQTCTRSGKYYCQQHPSYTIRISSGETFPPCNETRDSHGAIWIFMHA